MAGSLTIQTSTLSFAGTKLSLNANAPATTGGAGGTITFDVSGKTAYSIGTAGAAPQIVFNNAGSTAGGAGNGGNVFVAIGGALAVDQSTGIINTASNGGNGGIISLGCCWWHHDQRRSEHCGQWPRCRRPVESSFRWQFAGRRQFADRSRGQ